MLRFKVNEQQAVTFRVGENPVAMKVADAVVVRAGAEPVIEALTVTENGAYTAPDGVTGYSPVIVDVPIPDGYIQPSGELEVTENGTYNVAEYASVHVEVSGGSPDLPAGYARCDYIQFTGEQTVDTGIVCNQDTKIKVVFTREKSSAHYLFGVASSDNKASVTAYFGGNWRFGNKATSKTPTTNADMIYSGILSSSEITTTASKTAISGVNDFETVGSMLIGSCRNASGTIGAAQFEGKMVSWMMWNGNALVQKLVPVVSADGVYRFWDTVGQKFVDSITDTPLDGGNF